MTILFTFALGTAGDYIAETVNLGYWKSALLFEGCIGVIARAYRFAKLNAILAFWIAYILTRPLGASIGDYLSSAPDEGGLALGTVGTSALFLDTILTSVIYITVTTKDLVVVEEPIVPSHAVRRPSYGAPSASGCVSGSGRVVVRRL